MAEISFYVTDEEKMQLFDFVKTNNSGKFIPDILYDSPNSFELKDGKELIEYIYEQETVGYFILSPSFQLEPIMLVKLSEDKDKYFITQRSGGPAIDIAFYLGYAEDAPIKYKCTDIHYYPRYIHYNSKLYEEFPATEELKEYFKMIIKFLKSKCRQITAKNGKKYWVSKTLKEEDVV